MVPIGKKIASSIGLALILLLTAPAATSLRAEVVPDGGEKDHTPSLVSLLEELQLGPSSFFYRQTGRPDPFMPFLAIRAAAEDQSSEELTGLRRFEPGQLTLTAIVLGGRNPLAMVQDATGYGHIIRPGSAIGRGGIVERITDHLVTIRQQVSSLTGEKEYRTVEMVLMQEGEEK